MKKKLLAVITVLAVLFTFLTIQTVAVSANETETTEKYDENLRLWFDFREESFLGRDGVVFDTRLTFFSDEELEELDEETLMGLMVVGAMQSDVKVVKGLNGNALKFTGAKAEYDEDMGMLWSNSAFYMEATGDDVFAGDHVTINVVFQNETNDQMQPVLCTGLDQSDYMVLMTSWISEGTGPRMALKADDGAEQKIFAAADAAPKAGTWNMLTYVQDGDQCKIYLNGRLVKESALQYKLEDTKSYNFYALGAAMVFNDPGFKGLIDDFRVYGSALTEEEIAALAKDLHVNEEEAPEDKPVINPYETVKAGADATALAEGKTEFGAAFGVEENAGANEGGVGSTYNGAWMEYANMAFGDTGAKSVTITYGSKAARMAEDAAAQIWIGGKSAAEGGKLVGTVSLPVPEDRNADYQYGMTATADLTETITGTQDVYIVLTGTHDGSSDNEYIANVTSFVFTEAEAEEPVTPEDPAAPEDPSDDPANNPKDPDDVKPPVTGDAAVLIAVMTLLTVAVSGIMVLKKRKGSSTRKSESRYLSL